MRMAMAPGAAQRPMRATSEPWRFTTVDESLPKLANAAMDRRATTATRTMYSTKSPPRSWASQFLRDLVIGFAHLQSRYGSDQRVPAALVRGEKRRTQRGQGPGNDDRARRRHDGVLGRNGAALVATKAEEPHGVGHKHGSGQRWCGPKAEHFGRSARRGKLERQVAV